MPPALSSDQFEALLTAASHPGPVPSVWVGLVPQGTLPALGIPLDAEGSSINIARQLCFQEINRPAIFIRRAGLSFRAGL